MKSTIENLTKGLEMNGPVDEETIKKIFDELDFAPPGDYLQFIKSHNGAEGSINESYLQILPIQDLIKYNKMYEADKYAPGYLIFGSNLGGTAYAFDKKGEKIVAFEFVDMVSEDMQILGKDFLTFLERLSEQ